MAEAPAFSEAEIPARPEAVELETVASFGIPSALNDSPRRPRVFFPSPDNEHLRWSWRRYVDCGGWSISVSLGQI